MVILISYEVLRCGAAKLHCRSDSCKQNLRMAITLQVMSFQCIRWRLFNFDRARIARTHGGLMRKFLFGLALATAAQPALAAKWLHVSTSSAGKKFFVDVESFRQVRTGMLVWEKTEVNGFVEDKVLWLYDCAGGRTSIQQYVTYSPSGAVIKTESFETPKWSYPSPDSVMENTFNTVCGKA